ncbi:MAG: transglycosylase domain-containing protein [Pyrinomonadaceae bacterium]
MTNQEFKNKTGKPVKNNRRFARVNSEMPPKRSFPRRVLRFFIHPITVSLTTLFVGGLILILAYYWSDYSERINRLLAGEVFTRSAGVYSAPKQLRDGENITSDDLIKYLKSAGYIEKNSQADNSRSRFQFSDGVLEIEPGDTADIDNQKIFKPLEIKFDKNGKTVASITDLTTKQTVKETNLEPKILSSITAETGGRRKAVTFQDLPPNLVKAITATEDRSFFEHHGVNFRGIARALWRRYDASDNSPLARQGGSSITQQLVKNLLLDNSPTLERKVQEAYMSLILETRLSKEEIFTLYANQIYLGQQAGVSIYGVGEAANAYFGKDVSALSLPEAAFIAGIIRSPNRYNPYKNFEKVTERRNQVLDSMLEAGEISQAQLDEAKATQLALVPIKSREGLFDMPYFTQYAEEELPKIIADPEAVQHLRIYTTIDPDLQRAAYDAVTKHLEKLDKAFPKKEKGSLNAALVAIRPKTGEIVAMVGGRDFLQNQFNRATDAQRQPGSVFKPFVYATAINSAYDTGSKVFTTSTIFKDEKKSFLVGTETYSPNNYGDVFSNKDMTLRDALVKSKNNITVDLGIQLNIGKVMNLAAKAGMPKVERAYPSMALGTAEATPLQVATAYTTFANLGDVVSPIAINRVTSGEGQTVAAPVTEKKKVLQPDVAYILDDMMKDVINRGTAVNAQSWGFKNVAGKAGFAGKTGTSRDGWFAGFTPDLVCVVYVGFDNGDDLGMTGADSALPIWADFMREALNRHPDWNGDWQMPNTVQKAEIDTRDGSVVRELDASQAEAISAQLKVSKKNSNSNSNTTIAPTDTTAPNLDANANEIPPEFRRVELFINGTIPVKLVPETATLETPTPLPSATPFTTWQDEQSDKGVKPDSNAGETDEEIPPAPPSERRITVMICPLSGMRATSNCPTKEAKTFIEGEEPKEFCNLHTRPPN